MNHGLGRRLRLDRLRRPRHHRSRLLHLHLLTQQPHQLTHRLLQAAHPLLHVQHHARIGAGQQQTGMSRLPIDHLAVNLQHHIVDRQQASRVPVTRLYHRAGKTALHELLLDETVAVQPRLLLDGLRKLLAEILHQLLRAVDRIHVILTDHDVDFIHRAGTQLGQASAYDIGIQVDLGQDSLRE